MLEVVKVWSSRQKTKNVNFKPYFQDGDAKTDAFSTWINEFSLTEHAQVKGREEDDFMKS